MRMSIQSLRTAVGRGWKDMHSVCALRSCRNTMLIRSVPQRRVGVQVGQLWYRLADGRPVPARGARDRAHRGPVGFEGRGGDEELAEGAWIHVAQLPTLGEGDDHVGVLGLGVLDRLDPQQLPAHPKMHDQRVAAVERQEQVLAQAPDRLDGPALEGGAEVLGRGVAAHGAAIGHRHRLDLLSGHFPRQVLAQRFDFG